MGSLSALLAKHQLPVLECKFESVLQHKVLVCVVVVVFLKLALEGAGIAQLVVHGLAVHGVAGSILLWGHFPVEGIFPLELTWVQTPFPQNSFG